MNNNEKLKVIPLGGVEEIGINCTLLRFKDKIIVVDAGLGFSDVDHLGVDYLIPNLDYLKENKEKVKGIFITHGHLDHIGAIEHFLKQLDFPKVFATDFAMDLIEGRLAEAKILKQAQESDSLQRVASSTLIKSQYFNIQYFHINHSIPGSCGLIIDTPVGKVVHSGDFKFDNSPLNEPPADFARMAKAGDEGVRLLLSDSTNPFSKGHSQSEYEIMQQLEQVVKTANGRVVVATFASLVTRLYALIEIAKKTNRKVFITGRSMQNTIDIARKYNYINAPDDLFLHPGQVKQLKDANLLVLATGSQGEEMAALSRMARGEHREIKLKASDTVILSSSIIPGNDALVQQLIDEISKRGAKVVHKSMMNLHTSGHGYIEDQKLMLNLIRPKSFMPVHGYQYFLRRHGQSARETGVSENEVIIAKRGDVVELAEEDWGISSTVKAKPILVSGAGIGDVGKLVLQDREQLAQSGVVAITLLIQKQEGNFSLYREPHISSRGFVYVRENEELLSAIKQKVIAIFEKYANSKDEDFRTKLRDELENSIDDLIYERIERNPMIITSIEFI